MSDECLETEVLIIGCGIAGAVAALQLADSDVPVTVVTRAREPEESNTLYAQGGIVYQGEDDSPALRQEDVLRAGAGHCNPKAVAILAEEGPRLVRDILMEKVGVSFDRTPDGRLSLAMEGAHTVPRIVHVADATGRAIEIALLNKLKSHPQVTLLTGHTAVDLLTPSHHSLNRLAVYEPRSCVGAYVLDQDERRVMRCLARKTILATGGLGQIFLRTCNPRAWGWPGDGLSRRRTGDQQRIRAVSPDDICRSERAELSDLGSCPWRWGPACSCKRRAVHAEIRSSVERPGVP